MSYIVAALVLLAGPSAVAKNHRPGGIPYEIQARGAFTCDFLIPNTYPLAQVGPLIERDRMYMTQRPGMLHKHIPARFDAAFNIYSGGRYLFHTEHQAREYAEWVSQQYVLDGVQFLDRSYFIEPDCRAWRTIGAMQVGDLDTQTPVLRTERFSVPKWNQTHVLKALYPLIRFQALQRGLTGVWLMYDDKTDLVSLVYFADRAPGYVPGELDFASLVALESSRPLGEIFEGLGWQRVFDRTQWTLSIWYPFVTGDQGAPSVWPNSPPLAQPYVGDGVCEPSRGEDSVSAPQDCTPACGNGVADADETNLSCPSDVPAE